MLVSFTHNKVVKELFYSQHQEVHKKEKGDLWIKMPLGKRSWKKT